MQISTITSYFAQFPKETQEILEKVQATIQKVAPKAELAIKYGIPTFILNEKNLVHFGGFKKHLGFYPTPAAIVHFKKELKEYKTSKGCIQFPYDKKIPYTLIKEITKFRVQECFM